MQCTHYILHHTESSEIFAGHERWHLYVRIPSANVVIPPFCDCQAVRSRDTLKTKKARGNTSIVSPAWGAIKADVLYDIDFLLWLVVVAFVQHLFSLFSKIVYRAKNVGFVWTIQDKKKTLFKPRYHIPMGSFWSTQMRTYAC